MDANFLLKEKLTILLPVKDRPFHTLRVLRYFESIKCSTRIIVLDGSRNDETHRLLQCKIFLNLDLDYEKFLPDIDYRIFLNKLDIGVKKVKTDYVIWACDDDFINMEELFLGVNFLEQNPDFNYYTGRVVNFDVVGLERHDFATGNIRLGSDIYSMYRSINSNSTEERFGELNAMKPFEGLHRSSVFAKIIDQSVRSRVCHHHELNFLFRLIPLFYGRTFVSAGILLLRQHNTPGSAGSLIPLSGDSLGYFKNNSYPEFVQRGAMNLFEAASFDSRARVFLMNQVYWSVVQYYDNQVKRQYWDQKEKLRCLRFLRAPINVLRVVKRFIVSAFSDGLYALRGAERSGSVESLTKNEISIPDSMIRSIGLAMKSGRK